MLIPPALTQRVGFPGPREWAARWRHHLPMTAIEYTQFPILFTQHRTTHINTFWINYPSITLLLTVKQPLQNPTNTRRTHYWVENFFLKLQPATGEPYSRIPLLNIQEKCPHLCFPKGEAVEHPWNYLLAIVFPLLRTICSIHWLVYWCAGLCFLVFNLYLFIHSEY